MNLLITATAGTMESNDIMVTLEPAQSGGIQARRRRGQRLPPQPPPGPGGLGLLQKLLGQFIHGVAELFRVHTSKPSFSR